MGQRLLRHTRQEVCVRPGQARAGFSFCTLALSARVYRTDPTWTALGFLFPFATASSWLWQCAGHFNGGTLLLSPSRAHLLGCQGCPVVCPLRGTSYAQWMSRAKC